MQKKQRKAGKGEVEKYIFWPHANFYFVTFSELSYGGTVDERGKREREENRIKAILPNVQNSPKSCLEIG